MECLSIREHRSNIDLVADVTEAELKKVINYLNHCSLKCSTLMPPPHSFNHNVHVISKHCNTA